MTHKRMGLISWSGFGALLLAGALAMAVVNESSQDTQTPDDSEATEIDEADELAVVADDSEAMAGAAGGFEMSWHTVDGGGGTSSGGTFVLTGTIGQPDAGDLAGGSFVLTGGFWQPTAAPACPACVGDFNASGQVNASDLALLLGAWGAPGCGGGSPCCMDINNSGQVNASDLALLLGNWGPC